MEQADKNFVLGCLLGDGCITQSKTKSGGKIYTYPRIKIVHSVKQLEYLKWKAERLNKIFDRNTPVNTFIKKENREGFKDFFGCSYLFSSKQLNVFKKLLYPEGRKQIDQLVLSGLGLQELALFYMDDGSGGFFIEKQSYTLKSGKIKFRQSVRLRAEIATNHLNSSELQAVTAWIFDLTGCSSKHRKDGRLLIQEKDVPKFFSLIAPFVHSSLLYKLGLGDKPSES